MKIGVIVTEGHQAEHPPEKLAMACVEALIEIPEANNSGLRYVAALKLKLACLDVLTRHHADAQTAVQTALAADAAAHFAAGGLHDPGPRLDQAVAEFQAAAKGTEWEAQFSDPTTVEQVRACIGQSLVDIAHVSRLWHAVRNPSDKAAAAYVAQPTGIVDLSKLEG
jgi:hypothetical protein